MQPQTRPIASARAPRAAVSAVLLPLLSPLPHVPTEQQPKLFCCENDHDAVLKLKAQLEGKVFVIDCMVDRVCTAREATTIQPPQSCNPHTTQLPYGATPS